MSLTETPMAPWTTKEVKGTPRLLVTCPHTTWASTKGALSNPAVRPISCGSSPARSSSSARVTASIGAISTATVSTANWPWIPSPTSTNWALLLTLAVEYAVAVMPNAKAAATTSKVRDGRERHRRQNLPEPNIVPTSLRQTAWRLQARASSLGKALNTKSSTATNPWATAYKAAWVRSAKPNLAKISLICFFTVDSVTFSSRAISDVPKPRPKAVSTSRWRSVKDADGSSRESTAPHMASITSGSM